MLPLLQSPAVIDIRSQADRISPLQQFGPTVEGFLRGIIFVATILTFGYMIWGAVDWILSGGDSGKVEAARKKITHSLIGLTVLMSVGAIFLALQYFLGINVLKTSVDPNSVGRFPLENCVGPLCSNP